MLAAGADTVLVAVPVSVLVSLLTVIPVLRSRVGALEERQRLREEAEAERDREWRQRDRLLERLAEKLDAVQGEIRDLKRAQGLSRRMQDDVY